ncbi:MAG TPA: hypothetical protein EYN67_11520 [Flavobacteriales bacterium]|nr:hypothetical protein [Flavobacteriales bacterium]
MSNPIEDAFNEWFDHAMGLMAILDGPICIDGDTKKLMGLAFAAGVNLVAEANNKAIKEMK